MKTQNNNIIYDKLSVDKFELFLKASDSDKKHIKFLGIEFWNNMANFLLEKNNKTCQSCGYKPSDIGFLELHVIKGDLNNIENYKFSLLCKSCHTLQHAEEAVNANWIKLCNSIYSQSELVRISRSGNINLLNKIKSKEIILLDLDSKKYIEDIKGDLFNKRKTIKAIFGKNFPNNRLK